MRENFDVVRLVSVLIALFVPVFAEGAERLSGRVTTRGGIAIERAHVTIEGQDSAVEGRTAAWTDAEGQFALEARLPCRIVVSHSRFLTASRDVTLNAATTIEIALEPKMEIFEHVRVRAGRSREHIAPTSADSTSVEPGDMTTPPATLADIVATLPGVAEAGQGGIFQTYSVRGIAGQRLLTMVDGMPVFAERRAGASGSFLDPTLMGEIEVLRGPAATLYGSGAVGGVVQVTPKRFAGWDVGAGYETEGNQHFASAAWGGRGFSVGVAERRARNGESASGQELNDHFRQVSAVVSKVWTLDDLELEALLIPTVGRDIGKSNTDYPARITDYPEEDHMLARVGIRGAKWNASVWAHPNELHTKVRRDNGDGSDVYNEALDFGTNAELAGSLGNGLSGTAGIDLVGRRGVDAREEQFEDFDSSALTVLQTLDGGANDDAAIYGTLRLTPGNFTIEGGARALYNRQSNHGYDTTADTGAVGFLGVNVSVGAGVELLANAGTAIRYPTLTERFFTGTTGRGGVIGNPDLEPERSRSLDAGVRWYGTRGRIELFAFASTIADFIEQVDVDPDVSTFVNLTEGRIVGTEIAALYQIDKRWSVRGAGAWLRGRNDDGGPLADVPAHRASLGGGLDVGVWTLRIDTEYRWPKSAPGPGEKLLPSATLVSARAGARVGRGVTLTIYGTNLLDETYFRAADEKAPEAYGRAAGFSIGFRTQHRLKPALASRSVINGKSVGGHSSQLPSQTSTQAEADGFQSNSL